VQHQDALVQLAFEEGGCYK